MCWICLMFKWEKIWETEASSPTTDLSIISKLVASLMWFNCGLGERRERKGSEKRKKRWVKQSTKRVTPGAKKPLEIKEKEKTLQKTAKKIEANQQQQKRNKSNNKHIRCPSEQLLVNFSNWVFNLRKCHFDLETKPAREKLRALQKCVEQLQAKKTINK